MEQEQLARIIAHLEAQRAVLGDDAVDAAVAALRERSAALQPAPPEQQRKQVTIVFADISGFTAMSAALDAEDVTAIVNALWQRLDRVITSHGGQIDKHIGDAVMAIWGTTAREDDPEQAIRAALAMQEELAAFRAEHKIAITVRIGINTGLALLGEVGTTGEYTAIGDAVNTASRLQHAAPEGRVLISHDTYRHVRGIFEVADFGPLQLKGKSEPLQSYLVERPKPKGFRMSTRGVEGVETRMVGREDELRQLQEALQYVVDQRQLRMVTVAGEAGIGKSRLLYEFENWAELLPPDLYYFKGRARQETQALPYSLFRDMFSFRFQIQESDPTPIARSKFEQGIAEFDDDQSGEPGGAAGPGAILRAHFIGQLVGLDLHDSEYLAPLLGPEQEHDPQQLHDRASRYLVSYFRAVAARSPALLLLEDAHWADDSSLDLIQYLAQALVDQPVLVVVLARPALWERRPRWGQDQAWHRRLELESLSPVQSRRLVAEILRYLETVPPLLEEVIVGKAEGNPYYLEELIKILIDDGVITKGTPRWRFDAARLAEVRVPPTLTALLQARLDRLAPGERDVLQRASVVGKVFWDATVAYLGQAAGPAAPPESPLSDLLQRLCDRELIFHHRTAAFVDTQEYVYKNTILRQVTYESVLKRERRAYHARVAEWLIAQGGERAGEHAGLIAEHLEAAGEAHQAIAYLRQAAAQAAERFANSEAVRYLSRALGLLGDQDPLPRYQLLSARERVHDLLGARPAQEEDLRALQQLIQPEAIDPQERLRHAEVALRWSCYHDARAQYAEAIAAAQEAIAAAQSAAAPDIRPGPAAGLALAHEALRLQAEGHLRCGMSLSRQSAYEQSRQQFEQALALARQVQAGKVEASSLSGLGAVCWYLNDYAGARTYLEQALDLHRKLGDLRGQSQLLNNLGTIPWALGDHAAALPYFEQALRIARQIGDLWGEGVAVNNLGLVSLSRGDLVGARDYYQQSMRLYQQVGDRHGEVTAFNNLGVVSRTAGDYEAARDCYDRCLAISRAIGDQRGEGMALSNQSLVLLHMGQVQDARVASEEALAIFREIGNRDLQSEALTNLGHALAGLDDLDGAAVAYGQALALRREMEQRDAAMETLAGLARVSLARGDLAQAQVQVEEILQTIAGHNLEEAEEPLWIHLTCYQVLRAARDPRSHAVLASACAQLQERAARIDDQETRQSFLERVPAHRELSQLAAKGC